MRIESEKNNITIEFCGRAKDGLNVWEGYRDDNNSIEIFLGYVVGDDFAMVGGMCIPLTEIIDIYNGLLEFLCFRQNQFEYAFKNPLILSDVDFMKISAQRNNEGISFFLKIYDSDGDFPQLIENMTEERFRSVVDEFKEVVFKYPII